MQEDGGGLLLVTYDACWRDRDRKIAYSNLSLRPLDDGGGV